MQDRDVFQPQPIMFIRCGLSLPQRRLERRALRSDMNVGLNSAGMEKLMFESFKSFITEFVDGDKHPSQFGDDDYRLAAAALLVHAAAIDGEMSQSESTKLHAVIKQSFALDDAQTEDLIAKATAAEHELVDLYHFTHLLNRAFDEAGRARIVGMMWEIVYADGKRDELEDNLVWRAADLLGVSSHERIALRREVSGESDSGNEP